VRVQQAICEYCYATGGQYATGQVQFAQLLRYVWTRDAAKDVHGITDMDFQAGRIGKVEFGPRARAWIHAMVYAFDRADYLMDGGKVGKTPYPPERRNKRFARIHDSGDFFSAQYLAMWKAVCNALPDITFWAPSRIWATKWGVQAVNMINGPAEKSNLIIRPSAYHVNEGPVPRERLMVKGGAWTGWAAGSSAYALRLKPPNKDVGQPQWPQDPSLVQLRSKHAEREVRGKKVPINLPGPQQTWQEGDAYDWDCQTYAVDDEKHTCRHAAAPDGKDGCRACWQMPDLRINYTLH
jgi:hypothetical protein